MYIYIHQKVADRVMRIAAEKVNQVPGSKVYTSCIEERLFDLRRWERDLCLRNF